MVPHRIDELRGYVAGVVLLVSACGPTSPTSPDDGGTPPPTFTATGTVRQSGEGPPLEGVAVQAQPFPPTTTIPAVETITNSQGVYRLEGQTGTIHLKIRREGFEPAREDFFVTGDAPASVRLQPTVVVPAGSATMATLYPDDPAHTIAADIYGFESCEAPCRVIRVVSSVPATLLLRIRFPDGPADLAASVNGSNLGCCKAELSGNFAISPSRPLRVYVRPASGSLDRPRAFELTTELQA